MPAHQIFKLVLKITTVLLPCFLVAQTSQSRLYTVPEVCDRYPEKIASIFENLDLDKTGLEQIKVTYQQNNLEEACLLLLDYYRTSENAKLLAQKQPESTLEIREDAESVLEDTYTFQEVSDQVPRLYNGQLNWFYNGPEEDIEWAWALNRHYPVRTLLDAWYQTGNGHYLKYIDRFIQDWIISSWPYPGVKSNTAMWRGLEVSFRIKVWARVFFELIDSDLISPSTRLLILSSLPDHAHYSRNFHQQNNWLTMEISGLAAVAAYWPEFKESSEWLSYTINTMVESMKEQVYPDGVQTELTSSYHYVALNNFNQYQEICHRAGIELPEYYNKTMESMWAYLVKTVRPDGYGILNNDADRMNNRDRVLEYLIEHPRSDWLYIITNGQEGAVSTSGPSYFFPWAGHLISRNNLSRDAHWSFFDIGPWGSGHQHNDKLHLSVSAFGHDFLVDAGRFAYRGEVAEKFRPYAQGSVGHNVILFNHKGQAAGPTLAENPVPEKQYRITPEYDYAAGSFQDFLDDSAKHEHNRAVLYVHDAFWIVVDKVNSTEPSEKETLWHWHPDCEVEINQNQIIGKHEGGHLSIMPLGNRPWKIKLIKGQEEPEVQGWYSEVYNVYEPNVVSIYTAPKSESDVYVWLLYPYSGKRSKIKAEIITQDSESVELKIKVRKKGHFYIKMPYSDSERIVVDSMN